MVAGRPKRLNLGKTNEKSMVLTIEKLPKVVPEALKWSGNSCSKWSVRRLRVLKVPQGAPRCRASPRIFRGNKARGVRNSGAPRAESSCQ